MTPKCPDNTKKTPRLRELYCRNKFPRTKKKAFWTIPPCETSQETNGKCSEKLFHMKLFYFGWIFSRRIVLL